MKNLSGKTAFITGGASGIGLGIAKACAKAGMKIVIADIRQKAIDEALSYFAEKNCPAHGIVLDVTDREAFKKAADEAESKFEKIHLLVNNAGVEVPFGPMWKATFNDCDYIVGVNIHGVLNGILTILPRMLAHGEDGHVVSTASMAGLSIVPGAGLYSLTKHAVVGMMESLACELKGTNIGASAFCPGPFKSNITPSSIEVRPENLRDETREPSPPPPKPAEGLDLSPLEGFEKEPEEAGERVVRGVLRGDLYITTHPEFRDGLRARGDAVVRSFPDEPVDPERIKLLRGMFDLVYNPIFDTQTTPGMPDWN